MLPKGFDFRFHSIKMLLENPANGSTITGELGDDIGRGDRTAWYLVDEAGHLPDFESVDGALSQNTDTIFWLSTPPKIGRKHGFAVKRFSGACPVFSVTRQDDPRKDDAWYEKQKAKRADNPRIIAVEIDLSYDAGSDEEAMIPGEWVSAAIDLPLPVSGRPRCGFDVAGQGANDNCIVTRHGPVLRFIEDWNGGNTTDSAWRSVDVAERHHAEWMGYDEVGVGEGVRSAFASCTTRKPKMPVRGINTGKSPTTLRYDGKAARDMFRNYKAEAWWSLRLRFFRAWEYRTKGILHPASSMISIPNHAELIVQISTPRYFYDDKGVIYVESKKDLRKRGIKQLDHADACVMAYAPGFGADTDYTSTSNRPCAGWL
jgi:hypothetical protein